jgi:Flp pilus assembly pilin Flp
MEAFMKGLIRNQKGQGIIEYVIISSLIGICCLVAVRQFGEVVQKRIENMKSQLSQEIQLRDAKR